MGKVSRALNKRTGAVLREKSLVFPPAEAEPESRIAPAVEFPVEKKPEPSARLIPINNTDNWHERLAVANENFSGVAESFRKLRTLILQANCSQPVRTILILSADPQEGKSFVCANLGVSLARDIRHGALLVDCDLRRPTLHTLFGLKNTRGVADLLKGEDDPQSCILPTGLAKLTMLPAGLPPGNPAELVSSGRMISLLEEMVAHQDDRLLLLDSPPFQAAAETMVLARLVDRIVLVVRWGKSGRENIRKLIDQVGKEKIIGIVFNAFRSNILDRTIQDVGYQSYYYPDNY